MNAQCWSEANIGYQFMGTTCVKMSISDNGIRRHPDIRYQHDGETLVQTSNHDMMVSFLFLFKLLRQRIERLKRWIF